MLRTNVFTCPVRLCLLNRAVSTSAAHLCSPMAIPAQEGATKVYAPKIEDIVGSISSLTLLEVADLNALLKQRLNIPDAAPVQAAVVQAIAPKEEEEEVQAKFVQVNFAVKLTGFDPAKKIAVIKFVKGAVEGLNLLQAKKFVEELPAQVAADLPKEEAEKLKTELEAVGATAAVE